MKGKFITFEGIEGSGKTTQIKRIYKYLKNKKKDVLFLREPGGVKISEKIRNILLDVVHTEMSKECETLLYMAARAQLVEEVLKPALKEGKIVLCDRFLDSTIVYQGYGRRIDIHFIKKIGEFATQGIQPDLTFIFDIEVKKGLSRITRPKDRIETRSLAYHNRVREGYLKLAKLEPRRIKLIKADDHREIIYQRIQGFIDQLFR